MRELLDEEMGEGTGSLKRSAPGGAWGDEVGFWAPLLVDGRPFLTLGTLGLLFSGGFAFFLGAAGQFLPHDIGFLGMTASELCARNGCRIVHFMIHDRVSFGGTLVALAVMYLWLIHFPLRAGQAWAWWVLLLSNLAGFASFLTYLGFGYLDTWHGVATVLLLPCFVVGLAVAWRRLEGERGVGCLWRGDLLAALHDQGWGRWLMMATAGGMMGAGLTIMVVGMNVVFVPQDLEYMGATVGQLNELNPRLIPLIAHDRAGFGGGVFNVGFLILACVWFGGRARHLWQALLVAGVVGFGTAIGVHPAVGYNNPVHLAPACVGAVSFFVAMGLMGRRRGEGRGSVR